VGIPAISSFLSLTRTHSLWSQHPIPLLSHLLSLTPCLSLHHCKTMYLGMRKLGGCAGIQATPSCLACIRSSLLRSALYCPSDWSRTAYQSARQPRIRGFFFLSLPFISYNLFLSLWFAFIMLLWSYSFVRTTISLLLTPALGYKISQG
jgi:hypothetical protein